MLDFSQVGLHHALTRGDGLALTDQGMQAVAT